MASLSGSTMLRTNLQPPQNQLRKRRSTNAIKEEAESRKHIKTTAQDHEIPTRDWEASESSPGHKLEADEAEVGLDGLENLMANVKLDRKKKEQKGKENGWVAKETKKAASCTLCGVYWEWKGKCKKCTNKQCHDWRDKLPTLDLEPL